MNRQYTCLVLIMMLATLGMHLPAETYYVDFDGGNDENSGTSPESAFKHSPGDFLVGSRTDGTPAKSTEEDTTSEAKDDKADSGTTMASHGNTGDSGAGGKAKATKLQPGDTVIFKGGVYYRGIVKNSSSGGEGKPIVFDGNTAGTFGTGRAIIEGGESISGWKKCASPEEAHGNPEWKHLWYTDEVPANADPYLINPCQGERMYYIAVFPCTDALAVWNDVALAMKPAELPNTENKAEHSFADPYFSQNSAEAWNGAFIGLRAGANRFYMSPITKFEPESHRIFYKGITARYYPKLDAHRFTMLNAPAILTRPGQYVLYSKGGDKGKRLYCWPWDENTFPENTRISTRSSGMVLQNCAQVAVRGFLIENQAGKDAAWPAPGIYCSKVENLVIEDNLLRHQRPSMNTRAASVGISECKNVVVRKNDMRDTLTIGMLLSKCEGLLFEDNVFDSVLDTSVDFYTNKDVRCLRNRISGRSGLHANGLTFYIDNENVLVEGNIVAHEIPFTMWGAINVRVVNNLFDGIGRGHGMALWAGRPIQNLVIEHNTIVNTFKDDPKQGGIYSGNKGTDWVIRNNIIDGACGNIPAQTGILSHNLFLQTVSLKPGQLGEGGVLVEDLKKVFVDPEKGDYRPAPGSPAKGMGTEPTVEKDLEGKPRIAGRVDVGAYLAP